jgi:hypothetical protein
MRKLWSLETLAFTVAGLLVLGFIYYGMEYLLAFHQIQVGHWLN